MTADKRESLRAMNAAIDDYLAKRLQLEQFITTVDDPLTAIIISLHYVDGLTFKQIATESLGYMVTPEGAKQRCYRYLYERGMKPSDLPILPPKPDFTAGL